MNSLILISPEQAWGFQPILSGKFLFPSFTDYRLGKNLKQSAIWDFRIRACPRAVDLNNLL
ncbi:MAG: hypothetical protein EAZ39_03525 [Oscillatoriales cyanobacterium]|uniref:hypothetical protein n=1 Tax=Microcoleus sp. PH2017_05_CCC_O_A TaxID=2798816 RepID=UPI001D8B7834|nr:hypothetical protein [Microcoleus sp. PH2017_05_CCC_O_A]TAF99723.1 MAG: hypothetical protein EAZ45_17065 [Oscillatoriales cyanobacterium]MCC3439161.1 hypothetical protein [Microcoleus sp. PH2017_05_CCC_O_A]TAG22024.1 MAG: hypothetical protein EAZ39_03525 [Oscillatoriales cyanobacterium]TAG33897.1 MAG: hypothetical protein EAZ33_28940 [Oscillatoriales cyanobacterium]TAG54700.1 MAG: hypothetical protein EAZ28_24380 [Oscillatoriales cyanobacterium]